jgi:hypothetical protein
MNEPDVIRVGGVTVEITAEVVRPGVAQTTLRQTAGEPLTPRMWRELAELTGMVVSGGKLVGAGAVA